MYLGMPNSNAVVPLDKMTIKNKDGMGKDIEVLYNPQSYRQSRKAVFKPFSYMGSDGPIMQFNHGEAEVLSFELFFDCMSAGSEVGGSMVDKLAINANAHLPSLTNAVDVRKYTDKIYNLSRVNSDLHRPPLLKIEWSTLQFEGFLTSVSVQYTKFVESGTPVRAVMNCEFTEQLSKKYIFGRPKNSPDTTKFHTIHEGDSLWALSAKEYGQCDSWRLIADENNIANPRKLYSGKMIKIPAMTDSYND